MESRGLKLIYPYSRAIRAGEIHELMLTDEQGACPGTAVDHVSVIGFFEAETGGVILVGDRISVGSKVLGHVAGFDLTHMPNHMNIVIKTKESISTRAKVRLGGRVIIAQQSDCLKIGFSAMKSS